LLKAVALDAGCGWAWGWLGELRLRQGRLDDALSALDRAVALFAEWPEAFAWRGEALRQLGRNEDALRDLDHAVALGYKQYDAYLSRGSARQALGDEEGNLREMAAAVRSSPDFFEAQANASTDPGAAKWIRDTLALQKRSAQALAKASAALEKGGPDAALTLVDEALKKDPACPAAYALRAEIKAALGRGEAALEDAEAAVKLDPSADTYARRADLAQRYGYMESALRDVSLALALGPNPSIYQWRARTFLGMRHYGLAIKDLSAALEMEPDNHELFDLRAHVNLLLGRVPQAQEDIERALNFMPKQVNLLLRRGQLLALQGKFKEAHASAATVRASAPAWANFIDGYVYCVEKDYKSAAASFTAATAAATDRDGPLKLQAGVFGTIAKAFHGLGGKDEMAKSAKEAKSGKGGPKEKGKVYLCGLGVYPPQTATVEVLRGISECDVIFNNLPGMGMSEFLGLFCSNRRPVAFRYEQDAKLCADLVLSEVKPGRTVGFVTFGHPLLFGPLSHEIIKRCAAEKIPCKAFGAVSSMDAVLAASGQVLGYSYAGFQIFETTNARVLADIPRSNPRLPVVVYFAEGLGDEGMKRLVVSLLEKYSPDHECLLYGPKHELWETDQERVTLGGLSKISHHKLAQGILFVPPKEN
jgi:tetratricopeptide (TPR) repeat protein